MKRRTLGPSKLVSSVPLEFSSFPIRKGLDRVYEHQGKGGQICKMEDAPDKLNPSYTIVNKQLQDLVRVQNTVMARLKAMASKKDDCVPREEYDRLARELEEEKLQHVKTKAKLAGETEKLQFALGEIDILNKQLQREKATFENVFSQIKSKAQEENQERKQFQTKCKAMEELCTRQDDILTTKDARIKELKHRLVHQKHVHRQQLSDLDIHRQQEHYINSNTEPSHAISRRMRQKRVSFR